MDTAAVIKIAVRHDVRVARPPIVAAASPRPTGQLVSMMAIAVDIPPPTNQSATILASNTFISTAPTPASTRPASAAA